MHALSRNIQKICCRSLAIGLFSVLLLGVFAKCSAEQPSAAVSSLTGNVSVAIQGTEMATATVGTMLRAGDVIQTGTGANVVLVLSDGSELELGQNTRLDITILSQNPSTKARKSRLKLLWGKVRSVLSPGHQEEGSAFSVETPNALAGVKFSQPVIEVAYDPVTDTTTIDAHTVDVVVTNLKTMRSKLIQRGTRGIVLRNRISSSSISQRKPASSQQQPQENLQEEASPELQPQKELSQHDIPSSAPTAASSTLPKESAMNTNAFMQIRTSVKQATSSVILTGPGPSQPGGSEGEGPEAGGDMGSGAIPGGRSEEPERQRRIIMIHIYNK